MNADELREACEMAGARIEGNERGWTAEFRIEGWPMNLGYIYTEPALPAYVAELLLEKVWNLGETEINEMSFALAVELRQIDADTVAGALCAWEYASAADRIRACLQVLRDG